MKFALNGTLTIGTWDGATIEMCEYIGKENVFIFGNDAKQVDNLRRDGYDPHKIFDEDEELHQVLTQIATGKFNPQEPERYRNIFDSLVNLGDHYQLLADYRSYVDMQEEVDKLYLQPQEWYQRTVCNITRMGYFSSDRTIQEYAEEIWKIKPINL